MISSGLAVEGGGSGGLHQFGAGGLAHFPPSMPEFLRPLPPRFRAPPRPPVSLSKEDEEFSYRAAAAAYSAAAFPPAHYGYPHAAAAALYPYNHPVLRPLEYAPYSSPPASPLVRPPKPPRPHKESPPAPPPPPSAPPPPPARPRDHHQRHAHKKRAKAGASQGFARGSLIRLASGELRRVEDMRTEDFISSAQSCPDLRLHPSTIVRIDSSQDPTSAVLTLSYGEARSQVEVESSIEHPYFVYGQGWASCNPERTLLMFGLKCHQLQVGDVCISLSPRAQASTSQQSDSRKRRWSAPDDLTEQTPPLHRPKE